MTALGRFGDLVLRSALSRRLILDRVRRRSLVLLYHRVGPQGPQPHEVMPTVPLDLFCRQLEAISAIGEIVPLAALDTPPAGDRPRFALTFDDDDPGHAANVLPVLLQRRLPATFFLSGRWEHGLGPYWWEVLEEMVRDEGLQAVSDRLGVPDADNPTMLAAAIEGTATAHELAGIGDRTSTETSMTPADARALADAGMTIGFHTVDHAVMPKLSEQAVRDVVIRGRDELASCVGQTVDLFAYPHGRATAREAAAVADGGFRRAWTTAQRPVTPDVHPFLRGRWEPGLLEPDGVVRGAIQRLVLPPTGRERV